MFSWGEILVILIVAIIVIKPEDWPAVFRACSNIFKKLLALKNESKKFLNQIHQEIGVEEIKSNMTTKIKGDDGNFYETYDITDLRPPAKQDEEGK
jgi:Sec-independent protein translocase protein TatA